LIPGVERKRRKAIEALPLPGWYSERRKDLLVCWTGLRNGLRR